MIVLDSAQALAAQIALWKGDSASIGFVPTMGALHDGHISLVDLAKAGAQKTIVSIFVNPTQFAPHEDFDAYPRDLGSDIAKLRIAGVDAVYTPRMRDLYPDGTQATLKAGLAAEGLESDFRPHFFDGVVTVVHRLFEQVQPDLAVFGEKDFQQFQVIREMVEAEGLDIKIIGGETMRDAHGLALSSRNAYLSEAELDIARTLNMVLQSLTHGIAEGIDAEKACHNAAQDLKTKGFTDVDYIAVQAEWSRVLAAVWLGKTRLIDNMPIP